MLRASRASGLTMTVFSLSLDKTCFSYTDHTDNTDSSIKKTEQVRPFREIRVQKFVTSDFEKPYAMTGGHWTDEAFSCTFHASGSITASKIPAHVTKENRFRGIVAASIDFNVEMECMCQPCPSGNGCDESRLDRAWKCNVSQ